MEHKSFVKQAILCLIELWYLQGNGVGILSRTSSHVESNV